MNTVFHRRIRKLGIKNLVFLSIFGLVALAYIVSPLIALAACPNGGNGGGNGGANGGNNNNGGGGNGGGNKGNKGKKGKNNNGGNNNGGNNNGGDNNNNNGGNNNNNNGGNGNNPVVTVTIAGQNTLRIDNGVYIINKRLVEKSSLDFLQIVGPDLKPLTPSQYGDLLKLAEQQNANTPPLLVRVELVLRQGLNQSPGTVFTQGQFIAKLSANKQPIGAIVVTTDNQQKFTAQQLTTNQNPNPNSSIIPLHVPSDTPAN